MNMRMFLFTVAIVLLSNEGKSQQIPVNILDSNSVNTFIRNSTLCEQIHAAHDFTSKIVEGKGYTAKLLEALSISTGYKFFVPIANGSLLQTSNQRIEVVREQLYELSKQSKCLLK